MPEKRFIKSWFILQRISAWSSADTSASLITGRQVSDFQWQKTAPARALRRWHSTRRPSAADLRATAETAGSVCWNSCLTKRPSKQKLSLRFLRFLPAPDTLHGKPIRETNLLLRLNKIKFAQYTASKLFCYKGFEAVFF